MHRRSRHLNPVQAGAVTCLDSRYITGISNDATMDNWPGRAGSIINPSQSVANNKPVFKTNIFNGSPAVYFDDGTLAENGKFFESTTSVTSNNLTAICIARKTQDSFNSAQYSRICCIFNTVDNPQIIGDFGNTNGLVISFIANASFGGFNPAIGSYRNGASLVARSYLINSNVLTASVLNGTAFTYTVNGIAGTATTSATSLNSNRFRVGADAYVAGTGNANMRGYIPYVSLFYISISPSLRRRIEQSAAFSFKLACA